MKFLPLIILIFIPSTIAGYISITTYIDTVIILNNSGNISILIENSGDDKANNLKLRLISDYFKMNHIYLDSLPPNSQKKLSSIITSDNIKNGTYNSMLKIEYSDQNGKFFSAITPVTIIYGEPSFSQVFVELNEIEMQEKSTSSVKIKVKNNDYYNREIFINLYTPDEFSVYPLDIKQTIQSHEKKTARFTIRNDQATKGSNYAIFTSIHYEDEKYHYSNYKITSLNVIARKTFDSIIATSIILLLLTLTITYLSKTKIG